MFEQLLNGEVVNGIKLVEFNSSDYTTYALDTLDENKIINGVEYTPHYAFINVENDECAYVGVMYRDITSVHDMVFRTRVIGAKYEVDHDGGWCDFDTMMSMLTSEN